MTVQEKLPKLDEAGRSAVSANSAEIVWHEEVGSAEWDRALAELGGHPLQSALWGDARREVDGIRDHRLMALQDGKPIWMIRVEERRIPLLGWIGWAPRGPTGPTSLEIGMADIVIQRLRKLGMHLLVTDPWREASPERRTGSLASRPQTIWLDLGVGAEVVWENFHPQMRKGVRRAERGGVAVGRTQSSEDIAKFVSLCLETSLSKGFDTQITVPILQFLTPERNQIGGNVEGALFAATYQGQLASGLFVMRVGKSFHQIWGATTREFRQERIGEAVQWAAMQWALEKHCNRYDLEGIDPINNKGVYEFKSRLGGAEVTLQGKEYFPSGVAGRLLSVIDVRRK